MGSHMETFAARLATFDAAFPSIKSRASISRSTRPVAWPYESPSPEQLAEAGFFFNPYDTNPDNTTCFLCRRALDGWEDGDNPVEEHLKHSPDCGWAIMMDIQQKSSNPSEIEDPMSASIVEARKATFAIGWPHDGKRGWLCRSDKMVEAGWYFCPTDDSPDLASCPYCKLSLDGWEETDDPFEEHHRRSSSCSFFVYSLQAAKPTKKGTRSKKTRGSKASRLSTQSVMTTTSEVPADDDFTDLSLMSQPTTKKGRAGKRPAKTRTKKSKKTDPAENPTDEADMIEDQFAEAEPVDENPPEPVKPKRAIRGKKRASEAISRDLPIGSTTESHAEEPSPKRRTTAVRNSMMPQSGSAEPNIPGEMPMEEASPHLPAKKGRKVGRKAGSTKTRKASTASSSAKTAADRAREESILDSTLQESELFEFQYDDEMESSTSRKGSMIAANGNTRNPKGSISDEEANPEQHPGDEFDPAFDTESAPVESNTKKQPKRKPANKKSRKGKASAQELEDEPEPEPMQLERDNTPEAEQGHLEERPGTFNEGDKLESNPAQKSTVFSDLPVDEPQQTKQHGNKKGRKPTDKTKKSTRETKTGTGLVERAPSVEAQDELAALSLEPTESKSTTRKNHRKRKSQDDEDTELADEHDNPAEANQKRVTRDVEDHGLETEQQGKAKAKRGRPAKKAQKQPLENAEEQEDDSGHSVDEDLAMAPRSSIATGNRAQLIARKSEDQPKRGRPAKSKASVKPAKDEEDELQRYAGEPQSMTQPSTATHNNEPPKRGRPSKLKAPPKNAQRYSDLPQDNHRTQSFIESVMQSSPPQSSEGVVPSSGTQERTPSLSPQSSDAENKPPSARPPSARPPILSPAKTQTARFALATSTPTLSPSKLQLRAGQLSTRYPWNPSDIEQLLMDSLSDKENRDLTGSLDINKQVLTSPEMKMTVDEWIRFKAQEGEEKLKRECERLIGIFEKEGGRAMRALEGIECID